MVGLDWLYGVGGNALLVGRLQKKFQTIAYHIFFFVFQQIFGYSTGVRSNGMLFFLGSLFLQESLWRRTLLRCGFQTDARTPCSEKGEDENPCKEINFGPCSDKIWELWETPHPWSLNQKPPTVLRRNLVMGTFELLWFMDDEPTPEAISGRGDGVGRWRRKREHVQEGNRRHLISFNNLFFLFCQTSTKGRQTPHAGLPIFFWSDWVFL